MGAGVVTARPLLLPGSSHLVRLAALVALSAALMVLAPARADAQIVNVQSVLADDPPEGISGSAASTLELRYGNTDLLFVSLTGVGRVRTGDHTFITVLRGAYKNSNGDQIVAETFEHLRYRYTFSKRLLGEVFLQHAFNDVLRLRLRMLAGGGPKFDFLIGDRYRLGAAVAFMTEYEELRDDGEFDGGRETFFHRISSYITGYYRIDDRLQFVGTVYAQPRITDPNDIRLLHESQFIFRTGYKVAFSTSFKVAWDSKPPATVEELDIGFLTSLILEFE